MHRHVRRSFAASSSTTLLAAALLIAPGAQAAAATTCQGSPVTIDGTGMATVTGTSGVDVIAASQGSTVTALAGDDSICIIPGTATSTTTIDAGEGNDFVDSGVAGQPNPDKIDLGAGDDALSFHGVQTPGGSADFGAGDGTLLDADGGVLTINAQTRAVERNGVVALRWQGSVTMTYVESTATSVSFAGTDAAETFVLRDPATGATPTTVTVDMAGGDDVATIDSNVLDGSTWAGGDGTDLFRVAHDYQQVDLDLGTGEFETGEPDVAPDQSVTSFEDVDAVAADLTVEGSAVANNLHLRGCSVTVLGRAGADNMGHGGDDLGELYGADVACSSVKVIARGGRDADTIFGSRGDDRLFGGQGADLIRARAGDDVIFGGRDDDRILGKAGDDKIRGGEGDDQIAGHQGNDRVLGQSGNDALRGGPGFDRALGGPGVDTCRTSERRTGCEG